MDVPASKFIKNDGSPAKDKIFDPSIDMLINDFDDERTLEEEEAIAAGEAQDPSAELSSLEKEGNMPLEELLALYGYRREGNEVSQGEEHEEDIDPDELMDTAQSEPSPSQEPSKLSAIYEPMVENEDIRVMETVSRLSEDEEDLATYSSDEEMRKFKKTVMVGSAYQAKVPKGLTSYDDALPYENDDILMWDPNGISNTAAIEEYLRIAYDIAKRSSSKDKERMPNGIQLRDSEEALKILQECKYCIEEALKKFRMDAQSGNSEHLSNMDWSEIECKNFEEGLKIHGKNFLLIQKEFVTTRAVRELVSFYYMWKKTEKYEMFAKKIKSDKKKYVLNPGSTDYMSRFLEEQQQKKSIQNQTECLANIAPEKT